MGIKFTNNAVGTLSVGINAGDTAIALTAGHGARFPSLSAGDYFFARLKKSTGEMEIIKVTARSTDNLTAEREQDGTTALSFSAGDEIRLTWPRAALEAVRDEARKPASVVSESGSVSLSSSDKLTQRIATGTATYTLPPAANLEVGDWIDFKSTTTGLVKIIPDGADTLDGDAAPAYYRLPAFYECRVMKSAAGAYILARKPQRFVGEVFWCPMVLSVPLKGTLFSDNVLISRSTYAGLFDVYGTTHSAGDGSTFGKMDMRGRAAAGRDDMGGTPANRLTDGVDDSDTAGFDGTVIGAAGGSQKSQRHTHIQDSHAHSGGRDGGALGVGAGWGGDFSSSLSSFTNTGGTTAVNQNAFEGQSGNVQPTGVGNWLVQC